MYSLSLLKRSRAFSDPLATRIFTRLMGGGPRTFPGGINKWQWKRLHEKRAREKERRLLQQEKQLYQARVRSEIRAERTGKAESNGSDYGPMSSEDHVRVLANRFMKEGAEDLWNENDGPLKSPRPPVAGPVGPKQLRGSINSPIDLRKLFSEGRNVAWDGENGGSGHGYVKARDYSVHRGVDFQPGSGPVVRFAGNLVGEERKFRRNEGSSGDKDSSYGSGKVLGQDFVNKHRNSFPVQEQGRFQRNGSSSSDDDEDGGVRGPRWLGVIGGRGELGKYDVKITKRVPLKKLEEDELAQEVEMIRYQHKQRKLAVNEMKKKTQKDEEESIFSQKRFDESGISPLTVKALTAAGYVQMTRVQEASLPVCLEGKDALVKAKTGTGKTASFLLPAIEAVLKATSNNANSRVHPIHVLILCPTRELGRQIAAEANAILKYHDGIGVQTLVGGTRFKDDLKRLQSDSCQIIVATPGRLLDHIENKGGLSVRLMGLKMLVLDEADHLLDLGFRKDIEKIVDCLPRQRLSLLFTSTIPKEVRRIAQLVLRREHAFVDTVGLGSVETHAKVKQSFLVVPHELHFLIVHHLLKEHILHTPHYKVIVFCTTGMVTSLLYVLLRHMKMNVREMHSRKPQIYRTRVSDEFRESKRMILVTSDVSARGMNYPDVTLVIQVGIPCDREQYIHRLGRTGREGKDGEGILLLAPWEEYFLDAIKDLPLEKLPSPEIDEETKLKVEDSMSKIDNSVKEAAYHAWLGYYNSVREIGRDKTTLVELANQFCESIGLQKPPPLFRKTALKMGLKDIAGIRIRQ